MDKILSFQQIKAAENNCPICRNGLVRMDCKVALYLGKKKPENIKKYVSGPFLYCDVCGSYYANSDDIKRINAMSKYRPLIKTHSYYIDLRNKKRSDIRSCGIATANITTSGFDLEFIEQQIQHWNSMKKTYFELEKERFKREKEKEQEIALLRQRADLESHPVIYTDVSQASHTHLKVVPKRDYGVEGTIKCRFLGCNSYRLFGDGYCWHCYQNENCKSD